MRYQKPEVILLASAVDAIQSGDKGDVKNPDSLTTNTIGAYEADE
jgi:hypothetical protein